MIKLLIISSEPLNPQYILGSTFELSQAKILSEIADVSILSVSSHDSFSAATKSLLKNMFSPARFLKRMYRILNGKISQKKRVNTYRIEGIPVYEGTDFQWVSPVGFTNGLTNWLKAGNNAYNTYEKRNGRPELIHAHGRFLNAGVLALEIYKSKAIPYIYTDHSTVYQSGIAPSEARPKLDEVLSKAAAVVTVSKGLLNHIENFIGRTIKDAIIVPNVLDPIYEEGLVPKSKQEKSFKFISIASLRKKKGLDILLKAFKNAFEGNKEYKLSICGEGPLRDELGALLNELNIQDCVTFKGNLSKREVRDILDESDVLVVSSLQETFGVAVIEALARGCPVIATSSGGPEYILSPDLGILIEKNNVHALSKALQTIVDQYANYNRISLREFAISNYGRMAFLSESRNLYGRILNQPTR